MKLNSKVLINLKNLFEENYQKIQFNHLNQWLDLLIKDNPDCYNLNEQKLDKLYDDYAIENFTIAKNNKELKKQFEKTIEFTIDEQKIIEGFKSDLISSFQKIKQGLKKHENSKIQIILLTYSHLPQAWISGFGEGDYPILETPKYFDFNHKIDFFEILGSINYEPIWKNLIELDELFEELDIYDDILETDFYMNIRNSYVYKTYLLLNKAFEETKEEIFSNLDIKKPLYVYGHEHDCEKINVFCYE